MRSGGNAGPASNTHRDMRKASAMTTPIEDLKAEAKRLRTALAEKGQPVTHSQSLELLAKQRGYRDWNTLHAATGNQPPKPPVALGDLVSGVYLGRDFTAEVIGLQALADGRFRIKLDLETPVNVSAFKGMDVWRRRLNANIRATGETVEKTSDGQPQLRLAL